MCSTYLPSWLTSTPKRNPLAQIVYYVFIKIIPKSLKINRKTSICLIYILQTFNSRKGSCIFSVYYHTLSWDLTLSDGRPGSVVGIATAYRLDGPGIESRWGENFRTSPDRPWGPASLLYNGYRVFPGGKVLPGRDADPSPASSAEV